MNNKFRKMLLLLIDIVILYGALYLTLIIRSFSLPEQSYVLIHLKPFSILFIFWLFVFNLSGLYNFNYAVNNRKLYYLTLRSFLICGLFSAVFFYIIPNILIEPKTNLVLFIIVYAILFFLWRNIFNWILKDYIPKEQIAIIGYNSQVEQMIKEFDKIANLGFEIKFLYIIKDNNNELKKQFPEIDIYYIDSDLIDLAKKYKITNIVLVIDPSSSEKLSSILIKCLPLKINFLSLHHFYENVTGKVPIEIINKSWFLENLTEGNKKVYDLFKRIFDIILSLIILIVSIPFWIIAGIIIKLESKGKIFYTQNRIGKNDKNFVIYKFRTMLNGYNSTPTEKNDIRITHFGSFLRKIRFDETPQIINVLKGEMSFIGPRPERPELVKVLETQIPYYNERMLIKPGITGWDQTSNEYHSPSYEDTLKKLQYDLYYIKKRSVLLDFNILLKTISTILSRKGR
jgi:exopolysaccharide biosynthesis polyprenyl glycosylphosphotransferase